MNAKSRAVLTEFLGTALFVFIGAGSVVANAATNGGVTNVGIALAHGVGMAVLISSLMHISGAHFNPAVSLGLFVAGKIDARTLGRYVVAQLVGGIVGAALVRLLFNSAAVRTVSDGAPHVSLTITSIQAVGLEALLTFFLVSAVFGTAVSSHAPKIGGFGIGLAIFVSALVAGGLTGAMLNPARAFGPAVVAWTFYAQAVYWFGPAIGGAAAGLVWKFLLPDKG
ncbi:MAG TPA: aquaporin [Gemmatimonadales bacterium]